MFCKYCGKEISDEAYICTGCGRLAKELGVKKKNEKTVGENAKQKVDGVSLLTKIFMLITIALLGAVMICLVYYFDTYRVSRYGWDLVKYYEMFSVAIALASIALAFGIAQFVMAVIQDKKLSVWNMVSTIILIISVCTFVALIIRC